MNKFRLTIDHPWPFHCTRFSEQVIFVIKNLTATLLEVKYCRLQNLVSPSIKVLLRKSLLKFLSKIFPGQTLGGMEQYRGRHDFPVVT